MKALFAVALLALGIPLAQTPPNGSGLEIARFSYKEKLIEHERLVSQVVSMQPPVLNPSTMRQGGKNENPVSTVHNDTSQRMSDLNSLGMRAGFPEVLVPVLEFQAQMRNDSSKPITSFVWAYRSSAIPPTFQDQEYLCNIRIEVGETKPLKLISPIPRQTVVDASASGTRPPKLKPALQDLIINQVQYADDSTWQRPDWKGTILLTRAGARKLKIGKCIAL